MSDNRLVLGYDLSRDFIQISYMQLGSYKPETFNFRTDKELYNMPLRLAKRKGVNQWFVGEEAISCVTSGDGIEIINLYEKVMRGDTIHVSDGAETRDYTSAELLGLFIKKSFAPMGFVLGGKQIEALVITMSTIDQTFLSALKEAAGMLKIAQDRIFYQNHEESAFFYLIHQPLQLISNEVCLLDFTDTFMTSYRVTMNRKTKPIVTKIARMEHSGIRKPEEDILQAQKDAYYDNLDQALLKLLGQSFADEQIKSIYLVGSGFEGEWYQRSLGFLCRDKKVFGGDNLYSRGAALAAAERISPSAISSEYVLLGKEKLQANIGLRVLNGDEVVYEPVLDAGTAWHEAAYEKDFILVEGNEVEFIITPVMGGNVRSVTVELAELKGRPMSSTRLRMKVFMEAPSVVSVEITDLGFGAFFAPIDQKWVKQIAIGEEDE